jgi:type I restriction enzyme M protein
LKANPLQREHLEEFVDCYNPVNRHDRVESERFRAFSYDELVKRDKASLDIFWLRDESLEDSENLPAPDLIAAEIVENLQAALDQFGEIAADLADRDGATLAGSSGATQLINVEDVEAADLA